jgi:tripeptidyl-peptidase-1
MVIPPEPGAEIAEQDANTKKILTAAGVLVDATCNRTVTILCLQQLYGALGYVPSDNVNNSIAVTGYLNDYPSTEDLQLFYADQRRDAINSTFESIQIKGGNINQTEPGIEANLDSQFAFGISYPIKSTFYTTGGSPPFDPDLITTTNTNELSGDEY